MKAAMVRGLPDMAGFLDMRVRPPARGAGGWGAWEGLGCGGGPVEGPP